MEHVHYVALAYGFAGICLVLLTARSLRAAAKARAALEADAGDAAGDDA